MELIDNRGEGVLPVVIHCVADEGDQPRQSHITVGGNHQVYISIMIIHLSLHSKMWVKSMCFCQ